MEYNTLNNELEQLYNSKNNTIKVLHISFHRGCQNDIEYICNIFGFNLSFMAFDD